jgi:hypothetical protein
VSEPEEVVPDVAEPALSPYMAELLPYMAELLPYLDALRDETGRVPFSADEA